MKKILGVICAMMVVAAGGMAPVQAAGVKKGKCGKEVKWQYVVDAKILYIMGSGPMDDYGKYSLKDKKTPWESFHTQIKKIIICDGVTSVGRHAFNECTRVERVTFPSYSNFYISPHAFERCTSLDSVVIRAKEVGEYAFSGCYSLKRLSLVEGVTSIWRRSFAFTGVKMVHLPSTLESLPLAFEHCDSLYWVDVSSESQKLSSDLGRVCSKDGSVLYLVPSNELRRLEQVAWKEELVNMYLPEEQAEERRAVCRGLIQLCKEDGVLGISGAKIRRIAEGAISNLGKLKHLVLDEGIEELDCFSIGGGDELISISFPSTLKSFGSHGNLCLGAGCTHLQQVFIASPNPEQLMSFKLDKSTDRAHTIKYCWTTLAPILHEPDARTHCTWYVPKSAYERYKAHPLWGQLKIDTYSPSEGVTDIYWRDKNTYHYLMFER